METDNTKFQEVAQRVLAGVVVFLLTIIYVHCNRSVASHDAIAYAAKIRQQESSGGKVTETITKSGPKTVLDKQNINIHQSSKLLNSSASAEIGLEEKEESGVKSNHSMKSEKENMKKEDVEGIEKELTTKDDDEEEEEDLFAIMNNNNQWRCACEGGFLPPGMLQSLGGAEAVFRMGTGQCYHKQA